MNDMYCNGSEVLKHLLIIYKVVGFSIMNFSHYNVKSFDTYFLAQNYGFILCFFYCCLILNVLKSDDRKTGVKIRMYAINGVMYLCKHTCLPFWGMCST